MNEGPMKNLTTMQLWKMYKANATTRLRQELVLRYLGLVKYVVRKMIKNFPHAIEEKDLYHIGILGLVEALERFNMDYGIKFETYAIPRIKGSIIDELRKLDWILRSLRSRTNMIKEKMGELDQKFSGAYSDQEIAKSLSIDMSELQNWKKEITSVNML